MQRHVGCVTDAADAGGVDLGTVEVLNCAEADTLEQELVTDSSIKCDVILGGKLTPPNGIYVNRSDRGV